MWEEHWEHWEHMPPLEERTEYPYQNLRVKNYPWGNGDKVSLSVSAVWSLWDLADLRACFFRLSCKFGALQLCYSVVGSWMGIANGCSWWDEVNYHNKDKTT
jgi:hypothetical protein